MSTACRTATTRDVAKKNAPSTVRAGRARTPGKAATPRTSLARAASGRSTTAVEPAASPAPQAANSTSSSRASSVSSPRAHGSQLGGRRPSARAHRMEHVAPPARASEPALRGRGAKTRCPVRSRRLRPQRLHARCPEGDRVRGGSPVAFVWSAQLAHFAQRGSTRSPNSARPWRTATTTTVRSASRAAVTRIVPVAPSNGRAVTSASRSEAAS